MTPTRSRDTRQIARTYEYGPMLARHINWNSIGEEASRGTRRQLRGPAPAGRRDRGDDLLADGDTMRTFPTDDAAEAVQTLLLIARERLYDRNADEVFYECQLCGDVDGHTDDCPIPAVQRWMDAP